MQIVYRVANLSDTDREQLTRRVEKKRTKIERMCGRAHNDTTVLRVNARQLGHPPKVRVALSLSLRQRVLFSERMEEDALTALDRAVEALIEELRTHRATVIRERLRRRNVRLTEDLEKARPYLREQARLEDREAFDDRLRPLLRDLYSLAIDELRVRQVAGELDPGDLEPSDLVNDVVVRAYEAFRQGNVPEAIWPWLVSLLALALDEETRKCASEPSINPARHFDDEIPENDPRLDVSLLGDEALEFYQPDDQFHLEDILPDVELPDPAALLSAREQMRIVHRALKSLPRQQRQAFLLHADGFDEVEIGMVQHRPPAEILRDIQATRRKILDILNAP